MFGQKDQSYADHHFCAGGDAQLERPGDGVAEKDLKQIAGHREGPAQHGGQQDAGQPDEEQDLALGGPVDRMLQQAAVRPACEQVGGGVPYAVPERPRHLVERDGDGAHVDIQNKPRKQQDGHEAGHRKKAARLIKTEGRRGSAFADRVSLGHRRAAFLFHGNAAKR